MKIIHQVEKAIAADYIEALTAGAARLHSGRQTGTLRTARADRGMVPGDIRAAGDPGPARRALQR